MPRYLFRHRNGWCSAGSVEFVETAFDAVAFYVERGVVLDRNLAGRVEGMTAMMPDGLAVIGFVGDESVSLDALQMRHALGRDAMHGYG